MSGTGDNLPRRGSRILQWLGATLLRRCGWKVTGDMPNLSKFVIICAPHTSNWDFLYGICAMLQLDVRINWIGKHVLFRWPVGYFMRWLGGTPVRRDKSIGRVEQIVQVMNERERYVLGIAPEGTRSRTERWKTGFYHVAHLAGVPIVLAHFDYKNKEVGVGPAMEVTGDIDRDLGVIREHYTGRHARKPSQFSVHV